MSWILYIIGGFVIFAILYATGILTQFFVFLIISLICAGLGYLIAGDTGTWVGALMGVAYYVIVCIMKIVSPGKKLTIFEDGSYIDHKLEEEMEGIAGLVMLVILAALWYFG